MSVFGVQTRFFITLVAVGVFCLSCSKEPIQSTVDWGTIGGSVRNQFTDDPVVGAVVRVAGKAAVISDDGRYFLNGIAEGYHTLSVEMDGFRSYETDVWVQYETRHDIYLAQYGWFGSLTGRVLVGPTDIPLPGITVTCAWQTVISDESGHYRFDSVKIDEYVVRAFASHFVSYQRRVVVDTAVIHDIKMPATAVSGQIYHVEDGPVANATVAMGGATTQSDASGTFRLDYVPQGTHWLECSHPNYSPTFERLTAFSQPVEFDVRLRRSVMDSVWVTQDATIMAANFSDCAGCPPWGEEYGNYGRDETLNLDYYMEPSGDSRTSSWMGRSRVVIGLPDLPHQVTADEITSVQLVLFPVNDFTATGSITVRRLVDDESSWTEDLVTWSDAPLTYTIPYDARAADGSQPYQLTTTRIYRDLAISSRGLVLQLDETGVTETIRRAQFWSGEAALTHLRPRVRFTYIR